MVDDPMATPALCSSASPTDKSIRDLCQRIDDLQWQVRDGKAPLTQKYNQYMAKKFDSQIALMQANEDLFAWQHLASNVMMWLVVAVVVAGLAFSGFQLRHAMRIGQNADGSFEVSAQGLKVTSSIVGLLVLAMSIAFVVIFVGQVYTIHPQDLRADQKKLEVQAQEPVNP